MVSEEAIILLDQLVKKAKRNPDKQAWGNPMPHGTPAQRRSVCNELKQQAAIRDVEEAGKGCGSISCEVDLERAERLLREWNNGK